LSYATPCHEHSCASHRQRKQDTHWRTASVERRDKNVPPFNSVTLKETCVHPDGATIGTYVNGLDGVSTDTVSFIIHYSKKHGAHIVPAWPSWEATGNARGE
jgi:hypothetical protein